MAATGSGRQRLAGHRQDRPVQPRLARKTGARVAPMAVNSTHPDYEAAALDWARARDVLAGEDAVRLLMRSS
jgi:hypothetical protein